MRRCEDNNSCFASERIVVDGRSTPLINKYHMQNTETYHGHRYKYTFSSAVSKCSIKYIGTLHSNLSYFRTFREIISSFLRMLEPVYYVMPETVATHRDTKLYIANV